MKSNAGCKFRDSEVYDVWQKLLWQASFVFNWSGHDQLLSSDAGCQSSGCEFERQIGQHSFRRLIKVNATSVIRLPQMGISVLTVSFIFQTYIGLSFFQRKLWSKSRCKQNLNGRFKNQNIEKGDPVAKPVKVGIT